jgi:nicotinate-nucleotide adenylyltransferase
VRIGVFGGTFDPVHMGHLVLVQECWYALGLDKVLFVPANVSPFKRDSDAVSPADRLNMLRLALEGDRRFGISTYEIDKGGVSYTVDTLRMLKEEYGAEAQLFFLAGSDSAEGMSGWKDMGEMLELATFVLASRPGVDDSRPNGLKVEHVDIPLIGVSSTMIRERVRKRQPIDHIVPREVVAYIRNKGLYRD